MYGAMATGSTTLRATSRGLRWLGCDHCRQRSDGNIGHGSPVALMAEQAEQLNQIVALCTNPSPPPSTTSRCSAHHYCIRDQAADFISSRWPHNLRGSASADQRASSSTQGVGVRRWLLVTDLYTDNLARLPHKYLKAQRASRTDNASLVNHRSVVAPR